MGDEHGRADVLARWYGENSFMAKTFNLSVIFKVVDKATVPIRKVAKQMSKMGGPIDKVKQKIQNFARASVKALKKVGRAAKRAGTKIRSMGTKMAVGLGLAGGAAVLMVKQITGMADVIGKTADRIGITTEELQKLRFAGEQTGLSTAEMDKSLEQFNRRMGEAQDGTGEMYDGLVKLKIGLRDNNGQLKPMRQILDEVADKTANMTNETARADILYGMFGRSGIKMINTLKGGSKGLKQFGDQIKEKGGIIPEEVIRQSEKFNDSMNLLKKSIQGFIATALVPLLPRMTEVIDKMSTWIGENKELIKGFGETVKMLLDMAIGIAKVVGAVGKFIGVTAAKVVGGAKRKTRSPEDTAERMRVVRERWKQEKQQTEIKIKVASDKDSTAVIENVANIKGDPDVKIATEAYVGGMS